MAARNTIFAMAAVFFISMPTYRADGQNRDPVSVVSAYHAAIKGGDVDAVLALFTDDGYFVLTGGKKYSGKYELRGIFT